MPDKPEKEVNELAQQRDLAEFKALNDNPKLRELAEELDTEYYQRWVEEPDHDKREAIWNKANGLREVLSLIRHMATSKAEQDDEANEGVI